MSHQTPSPERKLLESALRIGASLLFGGIFYSVWLGFFLLLHPEGGLIEFTLWIVSPIITGIGFGTGILLINKFLKKDLPPSLPDFLWPTLGCILGAIVIYWFGPMLIVFSMLAVGTFSVFLREVVSHRATLKEQG